MALEKILANGVTEIIKKILPVITQQITQAWGVKDDLRKLRDTLEAIQAFIADAEEKQVNDRLVRLWMRRLKDVVYDADDVMDEFSYQTMRRHASGSQVNLRDLVSSSNPLLFQFKMARKIRTLNDDLHQIHEDSKLYHLQNTVVTQDNPTRIFRNNRLTSSVGGTDSLFLGREDAKSDILKILNDKSSPSTASSSEISSPAQNISTLSIVGMGGMGKTTIAQMVYNDYSIERNFELRAWVCVSEPFDIHKILRDVIESITGMKCEDHSNVDVVAKQVKEKLIGKKYLLVLDDLWNENSTYWESLKSYLSYGGIGSKILVTTRSRKVASVVGGEVHDLKKLSNDVCWSIIEKKIKSQGGGVLTDPEMIAIGKDIAEKCDGLPLAANLLGSSMCSKREKSYWQSIVDNIDRLRGTSEHTNVISILKLSYDILSSPLKQCFSYCCIFPKDWEINREMLIRLWIAEGFILPSSGGDNISLEDLGNEYFEYLVWSSFFQDVKKDKKLGDIETCKMHDLVHDLAKSVLDCNEFGIAKVGDGKAEVSEVRRLQLQFDKERSLPSPKVFSTKLRTIIALKPEGFSDINSFFRRRLRIFCPLHNRYYGEDKIGSLSYGSSISKLKHLRYLDLSYSRLSSEVSLNHSYNLQTLVLKGCENVPSSLLSKIGSLQNLRHLDISSSDIKVIPEDIGSLEHLSYLDLSYTKISKLPDSITCLSNLKKLKFFYCQKLDALPRELGALTRLRCLNLYGTAIKALPASCLNNLCNLEMVELGYKCELPQEIKNWPKLRVFTHKRKAGVMPRGIERLSFLETLTSYMVREENNICGTTNSNGSSGVEVLGGLNSLEVLGIRNLENVKGGKQGAERAKLKDKQHLRQLWLLWGSSTGVDEDEEVRNSRIVMDSRVLEGLQPHSNLKELRIEGFSGVKLPKWISSSIFLPNLVELNLRDCDNCEKLPALGMLPLLRVLKIRGMKSIKCLGEEFYYHQEVEEGSSSSASDTSKRSSFFPSLVELHIYLYNLEEWVAPPLSSSSSCFPSLNNLFISYHQRLRTTPITSFSSLKKLVLVDADENVVNSLLNRGGDGCLTSLTSIYICHSPDLVYLPPLGVLLQHNTIPLLQRLFISKCSNFQGFRDDGNRNNNNNNINSLRSLWLQDCPVLTSLPDLQLWTSLRELSIFRCDKLNKESIPYDLKKSLTFLEYLRVD